MVACGGDHSTTEQDGQRQNRRTSSRKFLRLVRRGLYISSHTAGRLLESDHFSSEIMGGGFSHVEA